MEREATSGTRPRDPGRPLGTSSATTRTSSSWNAQEEEIHGQVLEGRRGRIGERIKVVAYVPATQRQEALIAPRRSDW
jgi:hypothetical protein